MTWELIVVVLLVRPGASARHPRSPADSPLLVSFGHAISWFSTCKTRISCGAWRCEKSEVEPAIDRSVGFSGLELVEINRNALEYREVQPTERIWPMTGRGSEVGSTVPCLLIWERASDRLHRNVIELWTIAWPWGCDSPAVLCFATLIHWFDRCFGD